MVIALDNANQEISHATVTVSSAQDWISCSVSSGRLCRFCCCVMFSLTGPHLPGLRR
jgi:hypothetical protein